MKQIKVRTLSDGLTYSKTINENIYNIELKASDLGEANINGGVKSV